MEEVSSALTSFLGMAGGYATSKVLTTAARIGLLSPPYDPVSPEIFSDNKKLPVKGVFLLLNALVALGIYEKRGDLFALRDEILRILEGFPGLIWDLIHQDHLYDVWGRLEMGIRAGKCPELPEEELKRYPASLETFLRAMHAHASFHVPDILTRLNWGGIGSILDIGGGGAGFALALTRRFKDLKVTLVDLHDAIEITRKMTFHEPEAPRISFVACNAFTDPLPDGPFDRILISHLLHIYTAQENQTLIAKAAQCLKPNRDMLLLDYFLNDEQTAPKEAVIFRLLMMTGTPSGDCYTRSEVHTWIHQANLVLKKEIPLSGGNTLITARKP